jgi:hypothetical protein
VNDFDPASDRIDKAFSECIKAGEVGENAGGMPEGFVFIGTYLDDQGESRTVFLANNSARLQQTLGLLQLGVIAWNEQGRRWVHDED